MSNWPFDDDAFSADPFATPGFTAYAAEQKIGEAKYSILGTTARFLRLIVNVPGALLVRVGLLLSTVILALSLIGVYFLSSGWWRFSLVLSLVSLGFTLAFAWRRADLLHRLAAEQAQVLVQAGTEIILPSSTSSEGSGSTQSEFIDLAEREGAAFAAARAEFNTRSTWFLPQVEAGQRALRQLAGGAHAGSWLDHDLRPTLVLFFGAAVSVPCLVFSLITSFFVMLFGG